MRLTLLCLCLGVVSLSAQPPQAADLLIVNGIVVTVDAERRVLDTTIVGIGTLADVEARFTAKDVIDARGRVVMPGLINTHTHAPMVLYRGLGDDLALMDWLQKYIFPAEAKTVSPAFVRTGTELAALEMIRAGTTAFVDMYYFEEEIARVTKRAGLRGVLGQTVIEFPVADAKTPADALKRAETFIQEFVKDDLITPAVAPHAVYTNDAQTLTAARDLARKYRVPTVIHLAETEAETTLSLERFKARPVAALEKLGVFSGRVIAAHAVWLDSPEIAVLRRHGVGVAHNPESNMKLASGTAPVPQLLAGGVHVGLGTDGAASNNDLDMFEAMRQASFLHKLVTRDPTVVSARVALEMATIGGARVIGRDQDLGSLEVGKRADVIVVRMDRPRQTPMYDPVSHLVYATRGDDVETTLVNGRVLMRDRKVLSLDETQVLRDARAAAAQVRAAVGLP
jgi:5-methylthioadenosine/S-adenosylhomocysteine deaminase